MTWRIFACLIVGVFNLSGCQENGQMEDYAPERLPSIPKTAVWAGWIDGGSWIECSVDLEKNANWCTVWNDQSGTVAARTHYVLRETGKFVPESELQYRFFDGVWIELADGRILEPLAFHEKEVDPWAETPIDPPRAVGPEVRPDEQEADGSD